MASTTTNLNLPYPSGGDPNDTPYWLQALAESVDDTVYNRTLRYARVANAAAMYAIPSPATGMIAARDDDPGTLYRWTGSDWAFLATTNGHFYAENTGGGAMSTAWAASVNPATLTLPTVGTWMVTASIDFTLSLSANSNVEAHLFTSSGAAHGTGQGAAENRWAASAGGTSSTSFNFTRRLVVTSSSNNTVQIRRRITPTGGTHSSSTERLFAVRVG